MEKKKRNLDRGLGRATSAKVEMSTKGLSRETDMNLGKLQEMVRIREAWRAAVRGLTELDMNNNRSKSLVPGSPLEGTQASMPTVFLY